MASEIGSSSFLDQLHANRAQGTGFPGAIIANDSVNGAAGVFITSGLSFMIIANDGTVVDLQEISGDPLLAHSTLSAVSAIAPPTLLV